MAVPPKPGSPAARRLVQVVKSRRDFAHRHFSQRHAAWRESEKSFRGFVEPTKAVDPNVPWLRKLFVPVTPLLVQTQIAFDVAAFTQNSPVVSLDGTGPEDTIACKPMEALLEFEWRKRLMLKEVYGWLTDRRRYGFGVMWNSWLQDVGFRTESVPQIVELPLLGIKYELPPEERVVDFIRYEGNDAQVMDPFRFGFDPRVTASRFQDGEFVYREFDRSMSYLQEQSYGDDPMYHFVDAIPTSKSKAGSDTLMTPTLASVKGEDMVGDSDRNKVVGMSSSPEGLRGDSVDEIDKGSVKLCEMIVRLVPRSYEIGESNRPQLYWVTLANDAVVIRAEAFGYEHQKFPCSIFESNPDPHASLNISSVEEMSELQKFANWLYRSHAEHVIRTLNGQFVVDPSLVHLQDLLNPQPGNLIRLKKEAYGQPGALQNAIKQLDVQDVTRNHLGEIQNILGFLERLSSATENLQGVVNGGETTLGEQQMAAGSAAGRLRINAQHAWLQGMVPWTEQRIANAQQLLSEARWQRIVGGIQDNLDMDPNKRFVRVDPDSIRGGFDIMPIDGIVHGQGQLLQAWTQIFSSITNSPALASRFDLGAMLKWLGWLSGAKNLSEFEIKGAMPVAPTPGAQPGPTQVVDDEALARQVERGNLVPASELMPGAA